MCKLNMRNGLAGLLGFVLLLPMLAWSQTPGPIKKYWTKTIELKDRREDGLTPVVAKVTFAAYTMTEPTSPGTPILAYEDNAGVLKVEPIKFPGLEAGYIKFKITNIDWSPMGKEFDGSSDYKVIVRNVWVDMDPKIYIETKKKGAVVNLRKRYITAPNVEYVKGDSLPPPTIFKVDKNSGYTFYIGVKAVTPKTSEEKPFDFAFNFTVDGLVRSIVVEEPIVEVAPIIVDTPKNTAPVNNGNPEIDAAIQRAIDEERVDDLMELIRENPQLESAKNARSYLALKMTKELIDSSTYRIDITYAKFTRAAPAEKDLDLNFSSGGYPIDKSTLRPLWRDGKLYVSPPRDSVDYEVTAMHKMANDIQSRAKITLNKSKDFITFRYKEVAEDSVAIQVIGQNGPFRITVERLSGVDYFKVDGVMMVNDTNRRIVSKEEIAKFFALPEEGDYRFTVEDTKQSIKQGSGTVHLVPRPPIPPIVWYIAAGLLAVFFIAFLFYRREKRRKDEELEKLLEARGGSDPRVKRKPKPELDQFWKETAISELSLHKNFVREVSTYLKERQDPHNFKPQVEGVLLGTVLKFDFETERYEVRLDRFRALDPKPLDFYDERGDDDKWPQIREAAQDHRDLVKIGWLCVVQAKPGEVGKSTDAQEEKRARDARMRLGKLEHEFQDEQFSELFQLVLKIDVTGGEQNCGFFTRTTSGKINDLQDRIDVNGEWLHWNELENAGYYDSSTKAIKDQDGNGKIKVKMKDQETA